MTRPTIRERKQITVLFADIVKSSDMVRGMDPEDVESIFNSVISQQIEITEKYNGTVNQVMGDGIMCLFGAEAPFEDHALRAILAGEEMVRRIAEVQPKDKKVNIQIRVGINTGEVVLAAAKSTHYGAQFQATGEAVHITDRILKKALPNQLIISEFSCGYLEKYYEFTKFDSLHWNPQKPPIGIYYARRLNTEKNNDLHIKRDLIEDALSKVLLDKNPSSIRKAAWLHGEAGVGKTQLINNLLKTHGHYFKKIIKYNFFPTVLSSASVSFEQGILEALLGNSDDALKAVDLFVKNAMKSSHPIDFMEDCIKEILHLPISNKAYLSIPVTQKIELKIGFLIELVRDVAKKKKVLIILEDFHWANENAIKFIEELLVCLPENDSISILTTSRNLPPFDRIICEDYTYPLLLDVMSQKEAHDFITKINGDTKLSPSIQNRIYELSSGNPYFIKEYLTWIHLDMMQGLSLAEIKKNLEKTAPGKLTDIIYNRVASAGRNLLELAKTCSILGMKVNIEILSLVSSYERKELLFFVQKLEEIGLLKLERSLPEREWIFSHELLCRIIYDSIPNSIKSQLHSKIIAAIKKRPIEDKHLVLAEHAQKAGNNVYAYIYTKWAAKKESTLSRHLSCIKLTRQARQYLLKLDTHAPEKHEIICRMLEASSLFITGQYYRVSKCIDDLLKRNGTLVKMNYLEKVLSLKEVQLWVKGDLWGAEKIAKEILEMNPNDETYIRENARIASIYVDLGNYRKAIEHDLNVINAIDDEDYETKAGLLIQAKPGALSLLSYSYAELGNDEKAQIYFNQAYSIIEKSKDYFTKTYVLTYLAYSLASQEKHKEALIVLDKAQEYGEDINATILCPYIFSGQGISKSRLGYTEEGVRLCQLAIKNAETQKLSAGKPLFYINLSEALLLQGDYSQARSAIKGALSLIADQPDQNIYATAYFLLGRSFLQKGSKNKAYALKHLRQAQEIAEKAGLERIKVKCSNLIEIINESQKEQLASAV